MLQVIERIRNAARVRQIVAVAIRYGFDHVVAQAEKAQRGLVNRFRRGDEAPDPEVERMSAGERVRRMLEELGPTFIKVGQLLSTREDVVPAWAIEELRKLQDQVAPMPRGDVAETIVLELGAAIEALFAEFDPEPLASASIGQVHRAVLPNGQLVAVKVQRTGIDKVIERDLSVLHDLADVFQGRLGFVRHLDLPRLVEELAQALRDELVYTIEGRNAERVAASLQSGERVRVPKVYWSLTTRRVLTTEMFEAVPLSEKVDRPAELSKDLAERLARFMLRQMLVEGFFHADPHAGNLMVFDDGTLGIVDWGQVGLLSRSLRESLDGIFIAMATQNAERITEEIVHLGLLDDDSDVERFRHDVGRALDRYFLLSRQDYPLGDVLRTIIQLSYEHRVQLPAEVPMLVMVLVATEGTCGDLDPEFDLRSAFEPLAKELMGSRLDAAQVLSDITGGLRQLNRLATNLPRQVASILGRLETGNLRVKVEHEGIDQAYDGLGVIANRIGLALMAVGLLITGALLYPVQATSGTVILAAGLATAVVLLVTISRRGGV